MIGAGLLRYAQPRTARVALHFNKDVDLVTGNQFGSLSIRHAGNIDKGKARRAQPLRTFVVMLLAIGNEHNFVRLQVVRLEYARKQIRRSVIMKIRRKIPDAQRFRGGRCARGHCDGWLFEGADI